MSEHQTIDFLIIEAVRELCRAERLGGDVLPYDVWCFGDEFGIYAVEGTIRRRMSRLADEGRLIRVGERKGYRVPDWRRVKLADVMPLESSSEWVSFGYEIDDDLLDAVG
jgi:hypothetical protein